MRDEREQGTGQNSSLFLLPPSSFILPTLVAVLLHW